MNCLQFGSTDSAQTLPTSLPTYIRVSYFIILALIVSHAVNLLTCPAPVAWCRVKYRVRRISCLESDPKKSWGKITNFLKPKGPRSYPTLKLGNKTTKTNPEKAQLFAESVERNFGIGSHPFRKSHFDRINKFAEAHSHHFTPLDSLNDKVTDTDDDSDSVADVDPDTLTVRTKKWKGSSYRQCLQWH